MTPPGGDAVSSLSPASPPGSVILQRPINPAWVVTQPYGYDPTYPGNAAEHVHYGIDWAPLGGGGEGEPVYAAAEGVVTMVLHDHPALGNYVRIEHSSGVETGYAHLRVARVAQGQIVQTGQAIGEVGSTGLSTGPHLHFEVIQQGRRVDPVEWLA